MYGSAIWCIVMRISIPTTDANTCIWKERLAAFYILDRHQLRNSPCWDPYLKTKLWNGPYSDPYLKNTNYEIRAIYVIIIPENLLLTQFLYRQIAYAYGGVSQRLMKCCIILILLITESDEMLKSHVPSISNVDVYTKLNWLEIKSG